MSAAELSMWVAWLDAEQIGPQWDRLRHAQIVAALHNSGQVKRRAGGMFEVDDFLPPDPWCIEEKSAAPQTLDEIRAAARRVGMEM